MSSNYKKTFALPFIMLLVALTLLSVSPKQVSGSFYPDASDYTPLAPIEGTFNPATGKTNLSTYLTGIFKVGVAGAGVLAFLMIVWGGFTYLSTDVITGKEEGKARIERAVGGLILALTSYIILNTINPKLVELDLYFGEPADTERMNTNKLGRPEDLYNQQVFDDTIQKGLIRMENTKRDATALENLAKNDQAKLDKLADTPENKGERDALKALIAEESDRAKTRRTYDTASERIIQAANQGLEGMTVKSGLLMSTDDQISALKAGVAQINQSYKNAQVELAGKNADIARLFDERTVALKKICARNNKVPESVYEEVPVCNFYK